MIVLGCLAAIGIAWSDFGKREIHIAWFGLMAFAGILYHLLQADHMLILPSILFNTLCTGLMVGSIWLYFTFKGVKQIMDKMLGWGDVVMLLVLGIWLPPQIFLLLFTGTSLLLVVFVLILQWRNRIEKEYPIPLAGALGLAYLPGLFVMISLQQQMIQGLY